MHFIRRARGSTRQTRARALLCTACLLLLTAPLAHPLAMPLVHREDHLRREIESLETQWRKALLDSDIPPMGRLLADDYLGINANGTLETKADALAARRTGQIRISAFDLENVKVHVYGDTAVVTSRVDLREIGRAHV